MSSIDLSNIPSQYVLGDVTGASMEPTLYLGDRVVVDTGIKKPRRGDVVALKSVVHRFVWRDPFGGLWHSGDFLKNTARAPSSSFQGVVKSVIRDGEFVDIRPESISNWDCLIRVLQGAHHELMHRYRKLRQSFSS